jgi:hypothetical protein
LYNVHLPLLINGTPANGNWMASFIEAMVGMAVFAEDGELFDTAVAYWRARAPSYFYVAADGAAPPPNPQPNCSPQPLCEWYNQTVFNASVTGVCQETCRDLGHMQMGFAAFVNTGATARLQGVDLIAEQAPRLLAAAEFAASIASGARSNTDPLLCNGRAGGVEVALAPTLEIAHANFVRLGLDDPRTRAYLANNVRPHFAATGEFYICGPWETISHGLPI